MRYHGNYCGPNWSAGKVQPSVLSDVPSIDEFDETCRVHDAAYATNSDLLSADLLFFKSNIFTDAKRSVAAAAVGVQAGVRAIDKLIPKIYQTKTKMTNNSKLRGNKPTPQNKSQSLTTVPSAYGYTLRMQAPKVTRRGDTASIIGSDFAGSVQSVNNSNYEPAASVFINPAYFQNATLGSLARTYEKFRIKRVRIDYVPSVPTTTQGQVVMCSTATVKEPFIGAASSTFLGRALSQGNAVVTPIWKEASIEVQGGPEWFIVDALIDGDLDDAISHEVQVYATCDSTTTCGILIMHYEMEFKDPLYVYHPTMIPVPASNSIGYTLTDDSAVNAANDVISLSNATGSFAGGNGSIYRLVFQQARSVLPTGPANWTLVATVISTTAATTTTTSVQGTVIDMISGTTLYAVLRGSAIVLYGSLDGATAGNINDCLVYRTATTAIGTWAFLVQMVRLAPSLRVTTQ